MLRPKSFRRPAFKSPTSRSKRSRSKCSSTTALAPDSTDPTGRPSTVTLMLWCSSSMSLTQAGWSSQSSNSNFWSRTKQWRQGNSPSALRSASATKHTPANRYTTKHSKWKLWRRSTRIRSVWKRQAPSQNKGLRIVSCGYRAAYDIFVILILYE